MATETIREKAARELLHRLGVTRNYDGFPSMATTIAKVMEDEALLRRVTVNLYPIIAELYHTNVYSLQRNFRTIIDVCWREGNRKKLREIAGWDVTSKPTTAEFIDILVTYLLRKGY